MKMSMVTNVFRWVGGGGGLSDQCFTISYCIMIDTNMYLCALYRNQKLSKTSIN